MINLFAENLNDLSDAKAALDEARQRIHGIVIKFYRLA